jgi:hypothetical protein
VQQLVGVLVFAADGGDEEVGGEAAFGFGGLADAQLTARPAPDVARGRRPKPRRDDAQRALPALKKSDI